MFEFVLKFFFRSKIHEYAILINKSKWKSKSGSGSGSE